MKDHHPRVLYTTQEVAKRKPERAFTLERESNCDAVAALKPSELLSQLGAVIVRILFLVFQALFHN